MKKEEKIARAAQDFVKTYNRRKGLEKKDKINIDTLCNFGVMGLWTPRQISEAFYNSFQEKK